MLIARIDAATSVVVNTEVASLEWVEANADPDGRFLFVPFDESNPAGVGYAWDPIGGFHDVEASTYKLTADELTVLGVDLTHADALVAEKAAAVELAAVELTLDAAPTKGTK